MPGAPRRTDSGQSSNAATDCGADFSHRRSAGALRSMSATMKSGSAMASRSFADEWAVGLTARHMPAETAGGRRRRGSNPPGRDARIRERPWSVVAFQTHPSSWGCVFSFAMQYATNRWVAAPTSPHQGTAHENPGLPSHLSDFPGPAFPSGLGPAGRQEHLQWRSRQIPQATNQKYGSNADITFRRTCESSGVSAAYAAVGHSELAPSPAGTSGGAGSQSPAERASYSNGPAGATRAGAATGKQPFRYSDAVDQCVRIGLHPQFKATEQISNQCSYAIQITFCSEGVVARGTPRAGRSVIAAAGSRAPRRCGPGRRHLQCGSHRRAHALLRAATHSMRRPMH